jgi:NADH-ubiquinone oxidoreductase chain 5
MYLCVIAFPLLNYLIINLFGRFLGTYICAILSAVSVFLTFLFALFIFYEVAICNSICEVHLASWFSGELLSTNWAFNFDTLTAVMLVVVSSISSFVHFYSIEYMNSDPHQTRFLSYLSLFTFFMLILVTGDNFVLMFLGWEGIGLASFLLISFWFTRIQAGKSAIKAMLVNRVGDLGLIIGMCGVFLTFKSLDYAVVFSLSPCAINTTFSFLCFELDRLTVITLFLFIGVLGKSAQLGLHVWLPDAMEGPTPVSALIHAATLVTAGVFLLIRCSYLFELAPTTLCVVTIVGALTAFFASTVGLVQNDLKRVIAYSTCSQLGYMVFICGLSNYSIGLFHLANHAFFKALLFLSAGSIIHGLADEQDLRKMGGLIGSFPITSVKILIGSVALTGIPFFTGFYSKDVILEIAFSTYNKFGLFAYTLGCLAAGCTSFYSWRLFYLTFINSPNSYKTYQEGAHEPSLIMLIPLFFLAVCSITVGFLTKEMFSGLGTPFFQSAIFVFYKSTNLDSEFLSPFVKNIPLFVTIFGMTLSYFLIHCATTDKEMIFNLKTSALGRQIYIFLSKKWHFDQIFNELIVHKVMTFGYRIPFQNIDKGNIEMFGAFGISRHVNAMTKDFTSLHSGFLFHYLFAILFFMLTAIFLLFSFLTTTSGLLKYLLLAFCYFLLLPNKNLLFT